MTSSEIFTVWPELHHDAKRFELVLKGIKQKRNPSLDEQAVQDTAFKENAHINLLTITQCGLSQLTPFVSSLTSLTRLTLASNELKELPNVFEPLQSLKVIDVSNNQLSELPVSFASLSHLESLNAATNEISKIPDLSNLANLITVDLSHNKFTEFPKLASDKLKRFLSLNIGHNEIKVLPHNLFLLSQLKELDFSHNQLTAYPVALTRMDKLKSLNLAENPFKDTRFRKLANDKRAKISAIVSYLEKNGDLSVLDAGQSQKELNGTADEVGEMKLDEKTTQILTANPKMSVHREESVTKLRPYLLCCVLRNVDLNDPETMRKFINVQTKLHASALCANRTSATIGTHDADKIHLPLRYIAMNKDEVKITALHKKDPVTGTELLEALMKDAELARKRTKRSTLNPLHRYLHLVKDEPQFACLVDAEGLIISLPPITNSDKSKLSESTTNIWVEVSSPDSLQICRQVIQELVKESLDIFENCKIEQVRVEDPTSGLLVSVYPDKNDLAGVNIERVQHSSDS